jgi:hypothetical protein
MLPRSELVRIVASDLQYLRDDWNEQIDDDSLRRSSSVLRRLLVENELQRAWKEAGFPKEPRIVAMSLAYEPRSADLVIVASAGGAKYRGKRMSGLFVTKGQLTQEEINKLHAKRPAEKSCGLRAFIDGPCALIQGALVPRRVLVKYVANKLGGAHFDPKRDHSPDGKLFRRLDSVGTIKLLGKPFVYYELLSIGQALARSDDIREFCEKAQEVT